MPRVRVAALIIIDGRVVLARHRHNASVYHLLPGGGVDFGETLTEALRREVLEETGLDVSTGDLLFVNDTIDPSGTRHVVNLTFAADVVGGAVTASPADSRVEAVDLAEPSALPQMDLRPPLATHILDALGSRGAPQNRYVGPLFADAT